MSDPAEIVAQKLLDDAVDRGALLLEWRDAHLPRTQGEARVALAALRADGWRLVRSDVCADPDHSLSRRSECDCRRTRITEEWTG